MSRRRYPRSRAAIARRRARDIESLILPGLVIVVLVILYATGWWLAISGWAGDLLLEHVVEIGSTQPA